MFTTPLASRRPKGIPSYPTVAKLPDGGMPLKLALAWLVVCATPMSDQGIPKGYYSPGFIAAILDVVAREAFEVNPTPATFATLQAETDRLIRREAHEVARLITRRRGRSQSVPLDLETAAEFHSWMDAFKAQFADMNKACVFVDAMEREIRNRINEHEEELEGAEPIERRSPLGLYFRKVLIALRKLSFDETHILAACVGDWCGQSMGNGFPLMWTLNRERVQRGASKENIEAMMQFQDAVSSGDYSTALSSLRRFYDFQLAEMERGMHQHTLLNIATFHYNTGGLESALEAVEGAIRHARRAGDRTCVHKCTQLEYRIKMEFESAAWPGFQVPQVKQTPQPHDRLQRNTMPADEVWSIKAAVDLGEPVHVAFRRLYTALSYSYMPVADASQSERPEGLPEPHLSPALWHSAQAGLWTILGSDTLATLHEDMSFTSPDLDDETRLEMILIRADRLCDLGKTDEALALVLDGSTVDAMSLLCYRRWAGSVWDLLERVARQEGDGPALAVISGLRGSDLFRVGPGGPVREAFDPESPQSSRAKGTIFAHGEVTSALRRADSLIATHAPAHLALPDVLSALQLAGALGLWPLYARATLLFAETLIAMDLPAKAEAEIARVWDQLGAPGVARAALIRAKAHAAMAMDAEAQGQGDAATHFTTSARYADVALARSRPFGLRAVHRDARVLRTMLAEVAGLPFPRAEAGEMPPPAGSERVRRVGEIVRLVGVRVAEGWK